MNTQPTHSRLFVITLGLLTATAALTVDLSLPAIPALAAALDTSLSRGQQIVGIFMIGMAIGQIPFGLVADRFGRMPAIYVGLGIFTVAAALTSIAESVDLLLAARFAQGFGAASAIVVSRAIVRDVASGQEAARLMSLMTMIFTAAPVIAPSIGALLVDHIGWRAPFVAIVIVALAMILAVRSNLFETHTPDKSNNPWVQLRSSFGEFFSHRQSIFGLLLLVIPAAGFMAIIATSAALIVDIYNYSVTQYGLIFACAGLSILVGSFANRWLVMRFEVLTLIKFGSALMAFAGAQMAVIAWLDAAPFWWVWGTVCTYMFTVSILMANATVLALDPLPSIAGVASSIIGTLQNTMAAAGALVGAWIYNGSVRNVVLLMAVTGTLTGVIFLLRPLICPAVQHHPDKLARD